MQSIGCCHRMIRLGRWPNYIQALWMKISILILLGQTREDKLQVMYNVNSHETNSSNHHFYFAFQTNVTKRPAPFWWKLQNLNFKLLKIETNGKTLIWKISCHFITQRRLNFILMNSAFLTKENPLNYSVQKHLRVILITS